MGDTVTDADSVAVGDTDNVDVSVRVGVIVSVGDGVHEFDSVGLTLFVLLTVGDTV